MLSTVASVLCGDCVYLTSSASRLPLSAARRAFGTVSPDTKISVEVSPFAAHKIQPPSRHVESTVGELSGMHALMYKMRRMEVAAGAFRLHPSLFFNREPKRWFLLVRLHHVQLTSPDIQYKSKLIRGFCHLYDGQEAVLMGIEAAITKQDSLITTYRDHCHNLTRGGSVFDTMSELFGRATGTTRGIGGSMHMYNKAENFYGGNGIVGSGIPNGAGIAFAHKYRMQPNVCVTMYGDGAANQGQKYEALNLAALWELPCIFVCENNHYGMGTAEWRAAKSSQFYTRGDYIPGIKADGMDVLAVKQVTQFAKQYALEKGPIILELDTYRYHGHSMSDPGSTYRTRDEINVMRQSRDPIDRVKKLLLQAGVQSEDIKKTEGDMKKEVDDAIAEAKKAPVPPLSWMWRNVYLNPANCTLRDVGGGYVTPVYDTQYKDLGQIA